ncbi:unnamed protein product [Mytilus coruscus]|uniref:Uncharacterized protein n=1 Tax=Mytilus coruscus TaxID=42192 RepID=A0A6J8ACU1_MYTCO|nr:unnamed protein product [Mytilus coruscus]
MFHTRTQTTIDNVSYLGHRQPLTMLHTWDTDNHLRCFIPGTQTTIYDISYLGREYKYLVGLNLFNEISTIIKKYRYNGKQEGFKSWRRYEMATFLSLDFVENKKYNQSNDNLLMLTKHGTSDVSVNLLVDKGETRNIKKYQMLLEKHPGNKSFARTLDTSMAKLETSVSREHNRLKKMLLDADVDIDASINRICEIIKIPTVCDEIKHAGLHQLTSKLSLPSNVAVYTCRFKFCVMNKIDSFN